MLGALQRLICAGSGDQMKRFPFDTGHWLEHFGVDTVEHDLDARLRNAKSRGNVALRIFAHRRDMGQLTGHVGLHPQKPVPAFDQQSQPPVFCIL